MTRPSTELSALLRILNSPVLDDLRHSEWLNLINTLSNCNCIIQAYALINSGYILWCGYILYIFLFALGIEGFCKMLLTMVLRVF